MKIIWTIAFDIYASEEAVGRSEPTTDRCYLDPVELPIEFKRQVEAVLYKRVSQERHYR